MTGRISIQRTELNSEGNAELRVTVVMIGHEGLGRSDKEALQAAKRMIERKLNAGGF